VTYVSYHFAQSLSVPKGLFKEVMNKLSDRTYSDRIRENNEMEKREKEQAMTELRQ
jgi:hypothetical protein